MSKKRICQKALLILLIIMMIFANVSIVSAWNDGDKKQYQPLEFTADKEDGTGSGQISHAGTDNVKNVGGRIVGIIQVVGTIAAVAMLIVLGIKYMMGSAEERAEYKKTMFPYIVGAVLIFAAANLAQMIYTWASSI